VIGPLVSSEHRPRVAVNVATILAIRNPRRALRGSHLCPQRFRPKRSSCDR
jgi:hypothetical protein